MTTETTKTAEAWAIAKKHTRTSKQPGGKVVAIPDWRFAAAKAHEGWPTGQELSEADYDAAVARAIGRNRRAFSLTGGGETVMFLKQYHLETKFSFISTGGGAMLDFLAGEKLPGIEALKKGK